jgi:hypothetical protein
MARRNRDTVVARAPYHPTFLLRSDHSFLCLSPDDYYPGSKEGHIPTRSASEGSGAFPSLARRVNMQQHAELPCRGNKGLIRR